MENYSHQSDGVVDWASASEVVDAGSNLVLGQALEDFRKLAFTASLLDVQR